MHSQFLKCPPPPHLNGTVNRYLLLYLFMATSVFYKLVCRSEFIQSCFLSVLEFVADLKEECCFWGKATRPTIQETWGATKTCANRAQHTSSQLSRYCQGTYLEVQPIDMQNYYFEITHSVDPDQLLYRLLDTDRKINTDCRAPDIVRKINFNWP